MEAIKDRTLMSRMQYLPGCWMVEAALNRWKIQMWIDEAHPLLAPP